MRPLMLRAIICLSLALLVSGVASVPLHAYAQTQGPTLYYLAFSPSVSPADSLAFRQAIATAIDRDAILAAVVPYASRPAHPAITIQHPFLPEYDPSVQGYSYDAAKAQDFLKQSGWTGEIVFPAYSSPAKSLRGALNDAVVASLRMALGTAVTVQNAPSFKEYIGAVKSGKFALYLLGWVSDPSDFGYPSFALGLADSVFGNLPDPDLKTLLAKRDAHAIEQMLLDRALIVPIVYL